MKVADNRLKQFRFLCPALLTLALFVNGAAQAPATQPADNEYQTGAVLWMQSSGERNALCYQAFALARMMLDRDLRARSSRQRAIIVDVDETIMDNSKYQAMLVKNRQNFNDRTWLEWVNRAEATAIPGAADFLRYADSRGVRVFYITNRKQAEREGTAINLKKLGFPKVDDQSLLTRPEGSSSSKESRRLAVGAKYRIVLLMGDNLNDFAEVFENSKSVDTRIAAVERNKAQFGSRFIVLPNPMYGDWENAIYGYNSKLTEAEKAAKRKSQLRAY